jgi:hypothetical protein
MTSMESRAAAASPTRPWPADRIELWPIEKLIRYANNPRLHSAADIERIAASILKWGWTNPVLVDEQGVLIAGHGRGRRRGATGAQIHSGDVARSWSEEEKQAYRLADPLATRRIDFPGCVIDGRSGHDGADRVRLSQTRSTP